MQRGWSPRNPPPCMPGGLPLQGPTFTSHRVRAAAQHSHSPLAGTTVRSGAEKVADVRGPLWNSSLAGPLELNEVHEASWLPYGSPEGSAPFHHTSWGGRDCLAGPVVALASRGEGWIARRDRSLHCTSWGRRDGLSGRAGRCTCISWGSGSPIASHFTGMEGRIDWRGLPLHLHFVGSEGGIGWRGLPLHLHRTSWGRGSPVASHFTGIKGGIARADRQGRSLHCIS